MNLVYLFKESDLGLIDLSFCFAVSMSFISALIFIVYFYLLWALFVVLFLVFFGRKVGLFIRDFFLLLKVGLCAFLT